MNHTISIQISEEDRTKLQKIAESTFDNFLELVKHAKLNKYRDFVGASFEGMNLDGLDLTNFNFKDADFTHCSLKGTTFIDCELKGAAFNFPPTVRDTWHRKPEYIVGESDPKILELLRIASEASRMEERKEAMAHLLKLGINDRIEELLVSLTLKDKAKSIRKWLRSELTNSFKDTGRFRYILEKSIFAPNEDLADNFKAYLKLTKDDPQRIGVICHACTLNAAAIKYAAKEIGRDETFISLLINNISFSSNYSVWNESAIALSKLIVDRGRKADAFRSRLYQVDGSHELSRLATAAAYNKVRIRDLFELCAKSYLSERKLWEADDFLLYCYFFDPQKYINDVLYYSFQKDDDTRISSASAFAAYCFLADPELYNFILDEKDYFYEYPRSLVDLEETILFRENPYPDWIKSRLKKAAIDAHEKFMRVNPESLVRK